jgi:hypothetical protein
MDLAAPQIPRMCRDPARGCQSGIPLGRALQRGGARARKPQARERHPSRRTRPASTRLPAGQAFAAVAAECPTIDAVDGGHRGARSVSQQYNQPHSHGALRSYSQMSSALQINREVSIRLPKGELAGSSAGNHDPVKSGRRAPRRGEPCGSPRRITLSPQLEIKAEPMHTRISITRPLRPTGSLRLRSQDFPSAATVPQRRREPRTPPPQSHLHRG